MDCEKFTELTSKYRAEMYKIAYCQTKSCADADDVTQEAFLKLYRSCGELKSDDEYKAWLIRVTINCAKDLLKSRWYRFSEPLCENMTAPERQENELLDTVMRLSRNYRTVLFLFYYEGYNVSEIAKLLDLKQTTVTTRLSRGREKLRKALEEERGCDYVQKNI